MHLTIEEVFALLRSRTLAENDRLESLFDRSTLPTETQAFQRVERALVRVSALLREVDPKASEQLAERARVFRERRSFTGPATLKVKAAERFDLATS